MTDDPRRFLLTPPGQPGSGRVRYGAAMELWRQGQISAEVLEVYRVAAAHDSRDPLAALRDAGLTAPELPMPQTPMQALYSAARTYLLALDHPGAAEVRAGLPEDPGPERRLPERVDVSTKELVRGNRVVDRWLAPALKLLHADRPALAATIAAAKGSLDWVTYDGYPRDQIGDSFPDGHAFASIRGEEAPFAARDFDLGLFLIAPGVLYRDHHHPAPELYAPLTGPHDWRFGPGQPLTRKPAHRPVWNPSNQPHLTRVGEVPFLCLFVWTQDVNELAHVIPADDWALLEGAARA